MTSRGQARPPEEPCPLCARIAAGEAVAEAPDGLAVALRDACPVSEGQTLSPTTRT